MKTTFRLCSGLLALAAISCWLGAPLARAAGSISPPGKITYQGFLTDEKGVPLGAANPTNTPILFKIWSDATGGDLVYSEQQTVTIDKGHFSVLLGEGGPVSGDAPAVKIAGDLSAVFTSSTSSDRYLELHVGTPPVPINPRIQFFAVPYALNARSATQVVGPDGAPVIVPTISGLSVSGAISGSSLTISGELSAGSFAGNGSRILSLNAANLVGKAPSDVIPATLTGKRTFQNEVDIAGNNVLQLGSDLTRDAHAGTIGYESRSPGMLDIVGAGKSQDQYAIRFWNQGGAYFTGGVFVQGGPPNLKNTNHRGYFFNGEVGDTDSGMSSSADGQVEFYSNSQERMRIHSNGFVGIGTTSPRYPLEVSGSAGRDVTQATVFATYATGAKTAGTLDVSIFADHRIVAAEFDAVSDARIKEIVGPSDVRKDLETISRLRVTDYYPVDKVANGTSLKKGFIAQEVRQVIPEATTTTTNFVPDLLVEAARIDFNGSHELTLTLPKAHQLHKGDRLRIFTDERQLDLPVVAVPSPEQLVLGGCAEKPARVFVYGKEVSDFLALHYERIFTTGIGAIQELHRLIQTQQKTITVLQDQAGQAEALKREVVELRQRAVDSEKTQAGWEARFRELEKLVAMRMPSDISGSAKLASASSPEGR